MTANFVKTNLKITAGLKSQFPDDNKLQLALSGRSNVGKSSLINSLIGRKSLARVSSNPGKTITVNFYEVDGSFYLVDLPGYGFARRSAGEREKWSGLVNGYFDLSRKEGKICGVLQLVDLKVGPTDDDMLMFDYLAKTGIPFFVVATKTDKLNKTDRVKALEKLYSTPGLKNINIIPFSALNGEGKDEIRSEIIHMTDIFG